MNRFEFEQTRIIANRFYLSISRSVFDRFFECKHVRVIIEKPNVTSIRAKGPWISCCDRVHQFSLYVLVLSRFSKRRSRAPGTRNKTIFPLHVTLPFLMDSVGDIRIAVRAENVRTFCLNPDAYTYSPQVRFAVHS